MTQSAMSAGHTPPLLLNRTSSRLDLLIDADWSPQQAFAVFELLSDLRARIWMRYGV
ncbi:hypothetical protein VSR68_25095 [Paraburkholderia phymatum]|uniref:hypothetical protein n=1 Tax=Paraburkholderia phymatum TaxID=148447 RepID=UPI00316CAC9B